MIMQM